MNFAAIDPMLRAVLNAITGIPCNVAQDAGQSQFFPQIGTGVVTDGHGNAVGTGSNSQAVVTYEIMSARGIGWDEWRERYDPNVHPAGDTYPGNLGSVITEVTGNREITVQIKCECFVAIDGNVPFAIVERVRTAIGLPSVLELLNAAGLALQGCGETISTKYDDDNGREVGVSMLEIIFNGADGIEDIPQTTIEQIEMPDVGDGMQVFGLVTDT